jgi:predicted kinase
MQRELARRADWLRTRGSAGFVRRCHGDLHLGNICLWQGAPMPFDAVEFDEAIATGDVAYDLAFLLMDLEHKSGRPAANRVLNRYVARTGDAALVAGLPLFLAQKAMVRAHVEAARGRLQEARAYLAMGFGYLHPPPSVVLAIGGLQGTGKSTLARMLAPDLGAAPGALVLRSDEFRKRRNGVAPERHLPDSAYSMAENRAVAAELLRAVGEVAAAGHAVIADAMFLDPVDRRGAEAAAGAAPFVGIWLEAPVPVLEARIARRARDASDATVEVLRRTLAADPGPIAWTRLDATDLEAARAHVQVALRGANAAPPC